MKWTQEDVETLCSLLNNNNNVCRHDACMEPKLNLSSFMRGPEFRIDNCQRFNPVYCFVKRERERDGCLIE